MVKPPVTAEPVLTGTRKTLIEQQGEVGVKDPSTHAARQVGEISVCLEFGMVGSMDGEPSDETIHHSCRMASRSYYWRRIMQPGVEGSLYPVVLEVRA